MNGGKTFTLYTGPMFASKTKQTITHMEQLQAGGISYLFLTPATDTRSQEGVKTHKGESFPARNVGLEEDLFSLVTEYKDSHGDLPRYLVMDEVNFFTASQVADAVDFVERGYLHVVANGLTYDWLADPFPFRGAAIKSRFRNVEELFNAEVVTPIVFNSICNHDGCGQPAWHTYKLGGKAGEEIVEVGGKDRYVALCTRHYARRLMVEQDVDPRTKNLYYYDPRKD